MRAFFILFLTFPVLLSAQTEAWTAIAFEHEVSKRWGYVIDVEHRRSLVEDPNGSYLFVLAGNRPIMKNLSLTFGSRYEPAANGDPGTLRFFSDLNYKLPIGDGPFTLESRLRYQREYQEQEGSNLYRVALRPRIGMAAKLSDRFKAVVEYEGRFRFDTRNEWSRVRYTVGLEYDVSDRLTFELFGRQEDRINDGGVRSDVIFGLYANYTLPDSRDRDWKYRHPFGRKVTW